MFEGNSTVIVLLLCLFLMVEIGKGIEKEAFIDIATLKDLEIPWMWVASTAEEKAPQFVKVIDVIKKDVGKEKKDEVSIGPTSISQPRFIGNLKNKLCKVGLGIGRSNSACLEDQNLVRIKRSPQFVKVNPDSENPQVDNQEVDQEAEAAVDKENPETRLFGLNGLDGLTNLLRPSIDPSVGLYFGNPFYNGPAGGSKGPFQLDLGPISVNPFGQLRFTLHNGRPVIRPSVDFLVSSNKKEAHHLPLEYQNYPEYLQAPFKGPFQAPFPVPYQPPFYQTPQHVPHITNSQYPPYFNTQQNLPYIKKPKYPNYYPTSQYAQPAPPYRKSSYSSNYLPLHEDRNARHESNSQYEPFENRDRYYGYPPSSSHKGFVTPNASKFQFPTILDNEQAYGYPPSSSDTVFIQEGTVKQHKITESFQKNFGYPPSTSNTEFRPSPQFKHQSIATFEGPKAPSFSSFLAARDSVRDDRDEIFSQKEE